MERTNYSNRTVWIHWVSTLLIFGLLYTGISTLFLGAAARQTGGSVITTELLASKADVANQNFKDAGLDDIIELRLGNALETLKDLNQPIDLLVLDGWKDLYLPLFKQLEPLFKQGTVIYSDRTHLNFLFGTENIGFCAEMKSFFSSIAGLRWSKMTKYGCKM